MLWSVVLMFLAGGVVPAGQGSNSSSSIASSDRHRTDYFIQFTAITIGALAVSIAALSRNRPSRDTAYCGLLPMTFVPVARYVSKSALGSCTFGDGPLKTIETAINLPSGAR